MLKKMKMTAIAFAAIMSPGMNVSMFAETSLQAQSAISTNVSESKSSVQVYVNDVFIGSIDPDNPAPHANLDSARNALVEEYLKRNTNVNPKNMRVRTVRTGGVSVSAIRASGSSRLSDESRKASMNESAMDSMEAILGDSMNEAVRDHLEELIWNSRANNSASEPSMYESAMDSMEAVFGDSVNEAARDRLEELIWNLREQFPGGASTARESRGANNSASEPSMYALKNDVLAKISADAGKDRDHFETFTLPDMRQTVQAGDIRLQLTGTDVRKGEYNIKVTVDGITTEKKNQKVNEPLQFFAGNDRLSHEVFINWVTRNSAGGYLRIGSGAAAPREQYGANTPGGSVPAANNSKTQTFGGRTKQQAGGSMITLYGNGVAVPVEYDRGAGIATIDEEYNTSFAVSSLNRAGWIVRVRQPSGLFFTMRNGRWGLNDARGNEVVPPIYEQWRAYAEDLFLVRQENKWGIIDIAGNEVIPAIYEQLSTYADDLFLACLDGKWGIIDTAGNEITPAIYDRIGPLRNGFSNVRHGDNWLLMNTRGVIASPILTAIEDVEFIRYFYENPREIERPNSVVLSHWSEVKPILPLLVPLKIVDVYSGITYYVASFSNGNHADVETVTARDTALFLESSKVRLGGRPVWVTVGDTTYAAALFAAIHGDSTISDNNMDGHICLHFFGSTNHNRPDYEAQRRWVLQSYRIFELLSRLNQ